MTTSKVRIINAATVACLVLATPSQAMTFLFPILVSEAEQAARPMAGTPARPARAARPVKGLPHGARPLAGQEVFELYVGKTWKWGAGGGYFGSQGVFRARTYGDKGITNAGGNWAVNDKGRMCFRAVWTNSAGSSQANTCFDHMMLGGDLYQRRMPEGDWYVFRHASPTESDGYNKLVGENLVTLPAAN